MSAKASESIGKRFSKPPEYGTSKIEICNHSYLPLALSLALSGTISFGTSIDSSAQSWPASVPLSSLDGVTGFRLDGEGAGGHFGRSVNGGGDINGDGIEDLIIGADRFDVFAGRSYVVFGRDVSSQGSFPGIFALSNLDGTNGFRLEGEESTDTSGRSVSGAGDINGDGIDDVIIGAPNADPNGNAGAGSSYVVFGKDVAEAGDFSATLSLSDLDGKNGFRLVGETFDFSGSAVSSAGDVNGDGLDDLIVGAPSADPNGAYSGSSFVIFGRDSGFNAEISLSAVDGQTGFRIDGPEPEARSGAAVSKAGDINGDGLDDLVIGAPFGASDGDANAGQVHIIFGRHAITNPFPSALDLATLDMADGFRIDGATIGDRFGNSVDGVGDVNGDNIDDIVIGARFSDENGDLSGSAYVVFGRGAETVGPFPPTVSSGSLDGTGGFRIDGAEEFNQLGSRVSAAGDVNADGINDVLVSSVFASPMGIAQAGTSYIIFGKDSTNEGPFPPIVIITDLTGNRGSQIDGVAAEDNSGVGIGSGLDINNDGIDDVIIGARFADNNEADSGSSYVVFGGSNGPGSGLVSVLAEPSVVDFGPISLGSPTSASVNIINNGTAEALIDTITLDGAADFGISGDSCSGNLLDVEGANNQCQFDVTVNSMDGGVIDAVIMTHYNSPLSPVLVKVEAFPDGIFKDDF